MNQSDGFNREINYVIAPRNSRVAKMLKSIRNLRRDTKQQSGNSRCRRSWNWDVEEVKTSSRWRVRTLMSFEMLAKRHTCHPLSLRRDYVRTAVPRARTHESISGSFIYEAIIFWIPWLFYERL